MFKLEIKIAPSDERAQAQLDSYMRQLGYWLKQGRTGGSIIDPKTREVIGTWSWKT